MYTLSAFLSFLPPEEPLASFLLPVFSYSGSNAVYVHVLDSSTKVTQFHPIDPGNYYVIHGVLSEVGCDIGEKGIFAARLNDGSIICDRYAPFFESLAETDLSVLGSSFFNVDAYLMLRDFPARVNAIKIAERLFSDPAVGRLWAKMQNSIKDSGLFLPGIDPTLQEGLLGAARASDDLRQQIEMQIARLKRIEGTRPPIEFSEGRVTSMTFLVPRAIDIQMVAVQSQQSESTYRCQLKFNTRMGVQAMLEGGKVLTFDTVVESGATLLAKYEMTAPNTLGVEYLSLFDYIVDDRHVARRRIGDAAIS